MENLIKGYSKFLKKLIFLGFSGQFLIANAQELQPLKEYLDARPNWTQDYSELTYVGQRCAAVNYAISTYFNNNDPDKKYIEKVKELDRTSAVFNNAAITIGVVSKMSTEAILARYIILVESYAVDISYNKSKHNNVFYGYIEDDLVGCNHHLFKEYKKIDDKYPMQ